jgi:hypothetical protein
VSSLRPLENHVIPAKLALREGGGEGIQFVYTWPSACAGVTKPVAFISMGGPQAHGHSGQALSALPERHDFPKTPILLAFVYFRDLMHEEGIIPLGLTFTHVLGWIEVWEPES